MKRFDENDLARRLGGETPPPPPDLAARIRDEIPEHVEVPPALTERPGTLPFGRRPFPRRLLALAATVLVAVAAGLVARRVLLPAAAPPLEVALIQSAPAAEKAAAPPPADAASRVVGADQAPPPASRARGKALPDAEPPAKAAALPARDEGEKGHRETAADTAVPGEAPAPQAAAPTAAPFATAEPAEHGGVAGGVAGGIPGGLATTASAPLEEEARVYRVGGPVTAPELVHSVEPEYPEAARRARLRGVVVIETVVDRDGAVVRPRVVRNTTGSGECAEAALRAVRQWRYRPAQFEDRPVASHLTLAIEFRPATTPPAPTAGPPRR